MNDSLKRLTRLSRALTGRDKKLYDDFMAGVRLLEELDEYEHNTEIDKRLKAYLAKVKSYWPVVEMR